MSFSYTPGERIKQLHIHRLSQSLKKCSGASMIPERHSFNALFALDKRSPNILNLLAGV